MNFKKAVIISSIIHLLILIAIVLNLKIFNPKDENYKAIEVTIITDTKDLPSIPKKDIEKAVDETLGEKNNNTNPTVPENKPQENKMVIVKNEYSKRKNILERLKRIHRLNEKTKNINKGKNTGESGIQGTTIAQTSKEGITNIYMQKLQRKIHSNFFIPPVFDGDNPELITTILLKLKPDGEIVKIQILESSGNKIFDDLSFAAVKNSTPFPEVPDEFKQKFEEIGFGFRFKRSDF